MATASPPRLSAGVWRNRIRGEPPLHELLSDPCLHLLLKRDGLTLEDLRRVIAAAQAPLRRSLCCLAA